MGSCRGSPGLSGFGTMVERSSSMRVKIKRVYEPPDERDGKRILVDRLWPRGLSKQSAKIDLWLKDIAPSTELRTWFGHDPEKWAGFQTRYRAELRQDHEAVAILKREAAKGPVTLLYGAKDEEHNQAVVLQKMLSSK